MEFIELAFKRLDTLKAETSDCIGWAEQLLEEGSDLSCIAELASCCLEADPDPHQVERLFQICVAELGLKLPTDWHQAFLAYISRKCEKMLQGRVEPVVFLNEILEVSDDYDDPYILWIWIDLARNLYRNNAYGQIFSFNDTLNLEAPDECIRQTALQFISICSTNLPNKFPCVWWCQNCGVISEESTSTESVKCSCPSCGSAQSMKNMRFFTNRETFLEKALQLSHINIWHNIGN